MSCYARYAQGEQRVMIDLTPTLILNAVDWS